MIQTLPGFGGQQCHAAERRGLRVVVCMPFHSPVPRPKAPQPMFERRVPLQALFLASVSLLLASASLSTTISASIPFESLTPVPFSFLPAPQMLCEVLEALGADVLRRLQDSPPPCFIPNEPRHRSGHRSTRAIGIPPVTYWNWNRVPNRNRPDVCGIHFSCGTLYMPVPPSGGPGSLRSCKEGGGYPCKRGNNPAGHLNCLHPGMDYV